MIRTMGMDIGVTFSPKTYSGLYPLLGRAPAFARVFFEPGSGLHPFRDPAISALPPGTLPWISHKDPVPLLVLTTYWEQLCARYPGQRLRWTYYHEAAPDANLTTWADYWRRLLAAAVDFPNIEPVQIQTNYAMRWRTDTDWREWIIPGVNLGFDCYPLANYRYEPPESMFGVLLAAAAEYNIRAWGVPELGAGRRPGQDRGAWLEECVAYLGERGASFVGLWGAGGMYSPDDSATLNAFRAIMTQ